MGEEGFGQFRRGVLVGFFGGFLWGLRVDMVEGFYRVWGFKGLSSRGFRV